MIKNTDSTAQYNICNIPDEIYNFYTKSIIYLLKIKDKNLKSIQKGGVEDSGTDDLQKTMNKRDSWQQVIENRSQKTTKEKRQSEIIYIYQKCKWSLKKHWR